LVIQNDTSNRYSAVTMVAPITSTIRLPLSPLHVLLPAGSSTGLAVASVAVFHQIRAVDRGRLIRKLGAVDALVLAQVDEAIKAAFGLVPASAEDSRER
jgi:mRNA-degrading endonuclease toxin of MazEF toxin-antitoxin module